MIVISVGVIWQISLEETIKSEIISPHFLFCLVSFGLFTSPKWWNGHLWEPSAWPVCPGAVRGVAIWGVMAHWSWTLNLLPHCGNKEHYGMNLKWWRLDCRKEGEVFVERGSPSTSDEVFFGGPLHPLLEAGQNSHKSVHAGMVLRWNDQMGKKIIPGYPEDGEGKRRAVRALPCEGAADVLLSTRIQCLWKGMLVPG